LFEQEGKSFPFPAGNNYGIAGAITTIIVTNLPGSALFIQLCCTGCGARPRADGNYFSHI